MFDVSLNEEVGALSARSAPLEPSSTIVVELVAAAAGGGRGKGRGVVDSS